MHFRHYIREVATNDVLELRWTENDFNHKKSSATNKHPTIVVTACMFPSLSADEVEGQKQEFILLCVQKYGELKLSDKLINKSFEVICFSDEKKYEPECDKFISTQYKFRISKLSHKK